MSLRSLRRRGALPAASTLLLVAVLCAAPLVADNHELPSADEIIARHVEALGGEAAIRAHTSITTPGHLRDSRHGSVRPGDDPPDRA